MPVTVEELNEACSLKPGFVQGAFCQIPYMRKPSYVYFAQSEDGFIKIGCTRLVNTRLRIMQVDNCMEIKQIGKMKGGRELESELHKKFKEYRKRGEWFNPVPELLEYIANNKMYRRKV